MIKDNQMKKIITLALAAAATLANANQETWKFENLEPKRSEIVAEVNKAVSYSGGMTRLKQDAMKGDANALYAQGLMYHYGIVKKEDKYKAHDLFEDAAEKGHGQALLALANYRLGLIESGGELTDIHEGVGMLEASAEAGNPEAQYRVGLMYIEGQYLPEDRDLGLYWITKARDEGFKPAIKVRESILSSSPFKGPSFEYIHQRATEGSPVFLAKLAEFYEEGWIVTKDKEKAIRLLKTAAKGGYQKAHNMLLDRNIVIDNMPRGN
jgi:TPR repeat protein